MEKQFGVKEVGNKYLLFGKAEACHYWAQENLEKEVGASAKIVKHARDFLGMRGVKLIYCGEYIQHDVELYEEAKKYFAQTK